MIQVENLTKYYHALCAVDQINFNIEKGEIMGLLGPNGAGKTTLFNVIAGVLPPSNFQLLRHEHIGRMRRILVTMAKIVEEMGEGVVRIQATHNGNCGELADLTVAGALTA